MAKYAKLKSLKELRRLGYLIATSEDGSRVSIALMKHGNSVSFDTELLSEFRRVTEEAVLHPNALVLLPDAFETEERD